MWIGRTEQAASSAKTALDNFQAGTRNYVKGAATATRTITGGTAQKGWDFPLVDGASGMTFAKDSAIFAWVSYFVDGWTEDYAPTTSNANIGKTTGGSNNWDWYYGSAGVASGFVQVSDTTRRYWYKFRTAGYTFLRLYVYTAPNTMIDKSAVIYKPMVSFGSALADWQEAIEDTAGSVSAAQTAANAANTTASAAQTAAGKAQDTANTASSNASTALNTANAAKTAASEARTTASVASAAAEAANSTASEASSTATAAKTTADTAKSTANAAKTVAENTQLSTLSYGKNLVLKCVSRLQAISLSSMTGVTKTTTSTGVRFDFGDGNNSVGKQSEFVANSFPLSEDLTGKVCTQVLIASNVKPTGVRVTHWSSGDGHTNQAQCTLYAIDSTHWLCYGIIDYGSAVKTAGSIRIPDFFITLPSDCTYVEFSELKAAKASVPTAWSEAPEDTDYLRQSLQEATAAQTSITGGLILSKLIGVKSSAGVVVSGINGTDSAVGNGTPMLWAGATSKDTWNNAAFRVYNSGHVDMGDVSITSAGADGRLTLSEGDIMLSKSSGATTSLTSKAMGSLASALGKAGGQSVDSTVKTAGKVLTKQVTERVSGRKGSTMVDVYTVGNTETVPLFTAPYTGKCTITATTNGSSTLSATPTGESSIWVDNTLVASNANARKFITTQWEQGQNYISILTIYKDGKSISGTTSFDIVNGATYTALVQYSNSVSLLVDTNYSGTASSITFATNVAFKGNLTAGGSLALHLVSTEYVNKYYADGYMLFQNTGGTDSTLRYAGMTSADATVMQMRSGSSLLKFTADGLLQSLNGGGVFVREPLLFRVTYVSSGAKYSATCINLNKSYDCSKIDTGKFTLTHALGTSNYMAFAQVVHNSNESDWYDFAKIAGRSSTSVTIWLIDRNGSFKNDDCEVAIFRW